MLNRRVTYFAALAIVADALVLGAAWQAGPAVSLAAALAVPQVEPLLAPLYADPLEERRDVPGLDVYRPARARSTVVLVSDPGRSHDDVAALARALARRDITTIVPHAATSHAAALAHAQALGLPVRVAHVASLLEATPTSPIARALRAFDLLRLANGLLSAP
jgi:hypothetical protein